MLEAVNSRLKAGRIGVSVEQRGERLYLVATLPPKPGSGKRLWHQQRISLGIKANPAGFKKAELEAKKLGLSLAEGTFSWKAPDERLTVGQAVERFEREYFERRGRTGKTETTYRGHRLVFSRLDPDAELTPELLLAVIAQTRPDSRNRIQYCHTLKALAQIAGIDLDITGLRGNYSPSKVNPRSLPADQEIQEAFNLITNDQWRWVYGIMATFGLRNHEVFFVEHQLLIEQGICHVLQGKTVEGKAWPLHPEWLEFFDLKNVRVPDVTRKNHRDYGMAVRLAFVRAGVPFSPYALRHCWARRAIEYGLDSRLAAKQMRHSHSVHVTIYNAWIDEQVHQKAFDQLLKNENRPRPPIPSPEQ